MTRENIHNILYVDMQHCGDGILKWMLMKFPKSSARGAMKHQREAIYNVYNLLTDLKCCRDLERGRRIHSKAAETQHDSNIFVVTAVIRMYTKCRSMIEARRMFDGVQMPDVVCWTVMLLGYTDNGDGLETLDLFSRMKASGCAPDSVTYVAVLKACTSLVGKRGFGQAECLRRGREIHSEIGSKLDIFVQNSLMDMYAKCGSMVDARFVFDSIRNPDVVSWTALLLGYAENGDAPTTLELFSRMKACGCEPDSVTYIAALKACASLAGKGDVGQGECLKRGREIHFEIGCDLDIFVQNTLIDMYAKCGSMFDARHVFDNIQKPDVVSWNALLLGYVENGEGLIALELLSRMKTARGYVPSFVTSIAALKACGLVGALALGRKFHSNITEFNAHVVTCLVDFYAKCGSMVEALEVFDLHSTARVVPTWNALLAGYSSFGDTSSVFNRFQAMQDQGFKPDDVTFVCVLSCCSHAGLVGKAKDYLEAMRVQYGVTPTVMHYNCMVGTLGRANQVNDAIAMLQEMPCNPDAVTWMTLLGACCKWKNVEIGRYAFHCLVDMDKKNGYAYVLMAHIYGSRGMWEEQERALDMRIKLGAWTRQAYVVDEVGNMVRFVVGEEDPPQAKNKLENLADMILRSYIAGSYSSNPNAEKEEVLCGHSERRAVVYGILRTLPSEPVRAFKHMRMCDDCHGSTKMISKLTGRVIMVRDASRFHVMVNGSCSCGDYW